GHCLGAAGAVEALWVTLAVHAGFLRPTINYEVEHPECDLDYVPNEARKADVRVAVNNSFGFGGHNAVTIFKKLDDSLASPAEPATTLSRWTSSSRSGGRAA